MYSNKTIVISCAGMGKRLGMGKPKALVEVDGKPLIIRHLEMLKECEDVRVVVGYQAEEVIKVVTAYRKDVTFVFNHNYMNNGTGASVSLATKFANEFIITIDGDLLIHPEDMSKILEYQDSFVGVCKASTDKPVLTEVKDGKVIEFSREHGQYEWTGVCQFRTDDLTVGDGHVYQLIEPFLPMDYLFLRTKEIDTQNDYSNAVRWVKNSFSDNITIGIVGGMGSVATAQFFNRLISAFPAEKEWERPRIIIDNRCNMPSRVRATLYHERYDELVHNLNDSISMLVNNNCDYVVLACNTSHIFLNNIIKSNPIVKDKILNIIEICTKKIKEDNQETVKLLASEGTILSGVYNEFFEKHQISVEKTDERDFAKMRNWIEAVKQQKINTEIIDDFVTYINNCECDNIILGCTELPVLYAYGRDRIQKNIYDPLECVIEVLKQKQKEAVE